MDGVSSELCEGDSSHKRWEDGRVKNRRGAAPGTTEAVSSSAGWGRAGETCLDLTAQEALNKKSQSRSSRYWRARQIGPKCSFPFCGETLGDPVGDPRRAGTFQ